MTPTSIQPQGLQKGMRHNSNSMGPEALANSLQVPLQLNLMCVLTLSAKFWQACGLLTSGPQTAVWGFLESILSGSFRALRLVETAPEEDDSNQDGDSEMAHGAYPWTARGGCNLGDDRDLPCTSVASPCWMRLILCARCRLPAREHTSAQSACKCARCHAKKSWRHFIHVRSVRISILSHYMRYVYKHADALAYAYLFSYMYVHGCSNIFAKRPAHAHVGPGPNLRQSAQLGLCPTGCAPVAAVREISKKQILGSMIWPSPWHDGTMRRSAQCGWDLSNQHEYYCKTCIGTPCKTFVCMADMFLSHLQERNLRQNLNVPGRGQAELGPRIQNLLVYEWKICLYIYIIYIHRHVYMYACIHMYTFISV